MTTKKPKKQNIVDYSHRYADLSWDYHEHLTARARRESVLKAIKEHPHERILEIGCGMHPIFCDYAKYKKMTVVEPSSVFYQKACERLKALAPSRAAKVELIKSYIEDAAPSLKDHRFDCVLAVGMLHEVPDPLLILQTARQLVKKGAILHVNVPNANSFHRLLAVEMGLIKSPYETSQMQKLLKQPHLFDIPAMAKLVSRAGFKVLSEGSHMVKPFSDKQMHTLRQHGILTDKMQRGLEKMIRHMPQMGAELYITARAR